MISSLSPASTIAADPDVRSRLNAMLPTANDAALRASKMTRAERSRYLVRQLSECLHGGKMSRDLHE